MQLVENYKRIYEAPRLMSKYLFSLIYIKIKRRLQTIRI